MKKTLSLLLALVMLVGMLPIQAFAIGAEVLHVHDYTTAVTAPTCAKQGYTTYTCECGESYVDNYVEATGKHNYQSGSCSVCGNGISLQGKTISILGDSISTYTGISNNTNYNATIGNNRIYYTAGKLNVYQKDTWWQQTIDQLGLKLLVNNSWSGSQVFGTGAEAQPAYIDRCVQLHNTLGESPDIIAVYLGTNDFTVSSGKLGTASAIRYDTLITDNGDSFTYATPATVSEAYAIMLHKMSQRYPNAEIYCFTLLPRLNQTAANIQLAEQFNDSIAQIACKFGAYVVDLYNNSGIRADSNFKTFVADNALHPGPAGMDALTGCFTSAILENSRYFSGIAHNVSYNLSNAIIAEGTAYAVEDSKTFSCSVTVPTGHEPVITVTMGGADITASCVQGSKIIIDSVTGDITITAYPETPAPKDYRWEYNGSALFSVDNTNELNRVAGSISSSGIHSGGQYKLTNTVNLFHDRPWALEWKSTGDWIGRDGGSGVLLFAEGSASNTANASYLYRRPGTDFIGLGCYSGAFKNYGVVLSGKGLDLSQEHTYRMENRIAEDGSNMVWLLIDGVEMGPMIQYYEGGTNKNTTSTWVNGKDFKFSYMGTSAHPLGYCTIDYIQVWENSLSHIHNYVSVETKPTCTEQGYTTYTCDCGESYVDDYVDPTGEHSYENGVCADCGTWEESTIVITKQPVSDYALIGEKATISVEAQGQGLQYQWYYRDLPSGSLTKSTITASEYSLTVKASNVNREVYCVITDAYGNKITTETVKLLLPLAEELKIITQPTPDYARIGEKATISTEVQGVGLSYQWYYRDLPSGSLTKSTITASEYSLTVKASNVNREVYCVITDAHGNKITTETVKLLQSLEPPLKIITQPTSDYAHIGEKATVFVEAQGDGLSYQWYYRDSAKGVLCKSSITSSNYCITVTKANIQRVLYCVITDAHGNKLTTETVKMVGDPADPNRPVYYTSLKDALKSEAGSTSPEGAVAEVTQENGETIIRLLQNVAVYETLVLDSNVTLCLNGYTMTSTCSPAISISANVVIDGSKKGSAVSMADVSSSLCLIDIISGNCTINGGTYTTSTQNAGTKNAPLTVIKSASNTSLTIQNATITAIDSSNGVLVGIMTGINSSLTVSNSQILVSTGKSMENIGIHAKGTAVLTKCSVIAESDYTGVNNQYTSLSRGILSESALELYDCYVWGAHSGVTAKNRVYVDGGTYEGYGHGAFYLSGSSEVSYIYNATVRMAAMREGTYADTVAGTNGAGMYIGAQSNITVYMDNCNIYGTYYGIVLRSSGGEKNNNLYISNCVFTGCSKYAYRIGNTSSTVSLKVYDGIGNNYAAISGQVYNYSIRYEVTDKSYAQNVVG